MKRLIVRAVPILVAFAVGFGVGFFVEGVEANASFASREDEISSDACETSASTENAVSVEANVSFASGDEDKTSSDAIETNTSTESNASTVEVVVDHSPPPDSEITAAHAARRARRVAARETRAKERKDFMTSLNTELLTPAQREVHSLYLEAIEARDKAMKEISELRSRGEEVPAELQMQLSDAQSVLRADRDAEFRALREAAARAAGLSEAGIQQLINDLNSIDDLRL